MVWGNFECLEEVVEDVMHQAGVLQGLLQEALVGRQDLSEAEGGSKGWSGAEVLFMQRACSEEGFLQEARVGIRSWSKAAVRQQALVVERFMQKGFFLKGCLHEAVKGVQDGEALRSAVAAAETAGACQDELAMARPQLEDLEAVAAGPAAAVSETEDWPDFERMASAVTDFVCQVRDGGPGLSEDEVAEDFELYDEALD